MQLLILNEEGEVELDKIWLKTNPVLWRLYERDNDRTRVGDTQARRREKAKREYLFLYKMFNPTDSEFADLPLLERFKLVAKLYKIPIEIRQIRLPKAIAKDPDTFEEKVFIREDEELQEALDMYERIINSLVSVRLYNAAKISMDRKVDFLTTFDFNARDKMGKLLMPPKEHSGAIEMLDKDFANLKKYTNSMKQELGSTDVRTKSTLVLGVNEVKRREFKEHNPLALPETSNSVEEGIVSEY